MKYLQQGYGENPLFSQSQLQLHFIDYTGDTREFLLLSDAPGNLKKEAEDRQDNEMGLS